MARLRIARSEALASMVTRRVEAQRVERRVEMVRPHVGHRAVAEVPDPSPDERRVARRGRAVRLVGRARGPS